MKNTRKIIAMLAIFGASIVMQAQTPTKSEKINSETGMTETTYEEETPVPQQDKTKISVIVPEKVKSAFDEGYYTKDLKVIWSKEGGNYKARFTNSGLESIAVYDKNGTLIRSERELGKTDYPSQISTYYSKNNSGEKNRKVWESNQNGVIKYYSKDNGRITWFDKDGNRVTGNEHMAHHTGGHTNTSTNTSHTNHTRNGK